MHFFSALKAHQIWTQLDLTIPYLCPACSEYEYSKRDDLLARVTIRVAYGPPEWSTYAWETVIGATGTGRGDVELDVEKKMREEPKKLMTTENSAQVELPKNFLPKFDVEVGDSGE